MKSKEDLDDFLNKLNVAVPKYAAPILDTIASGESVYVTAPRGQGRDQAKKAFEKYKSNREEYLLGIIVDYVGCPYQHFTDVFYRRSHDPNLPDWYFHLCGSNSQFTCPKTDENIAECWLRLAEEYEK